MSHFSVLVALPGDTQMSNLESTLSDVMERWNENRDVEPYRRYEEGSPEDHWFVRSARRGAEHHRNGTGIRPHDPNVLGWSTHGAVKETVEQQRAAFAEDARLATQLGEHPNWETVVKLYNEKYHPGNEVAVAGDDSPDERLHYDAESDRAYTMRIYNPESKWDYWRIGGRWGDYFVVREQGPGLISGNRSWDSPDPQKAGVPRCDGGPLRLLDLDVMRAEAEREAHERYDRWERLAALHPPAKSWDHYRGLAELGEITWDSARESYRRQSLIQAVDKAELVGWGGCAVEEFLPPPDEYVAAAQRAAVPGYALVTLDREWVAPGHMGWFGMSSDGPGERAGYHAAVNAYIDQLDPATILVALDCHI